MKKLLMIIVSVFYLSACSTAMFQQKEIQVSENLPRIDEIKHISDMTSIAFEWQNVAASNIDGFYLYRGTGAEMKLIATIKDKHQTHYVDRNLEPNTTYTYMLRTFSKAGFISQDGAIINATTLPRPEAIPFIQASQNLASAIKIIWRPHPDTRIESYEVQRNSGRNGEFEKIASIRGRLNVEYIDSDLKPEQNFVYRVFAITYDKVYSEPSAEVSSTTKALPPSVQYLSASTDLAGKIALQWDNEYFADFAYYKIYASSSALLPFTNIAKTTTNSYEDYVEDIGKKKSYKVTIVDKDGLESPMPKESVQGMTLGRLNAPVITLSAVRANGIEIGWENNDSRSVEYIVKRYGGQKDAIFKGLKTRNFTDTSAENGVVYKYEVIAVDINGIESEPSGKIKVGR